jgi:hypothetical protein
MPAAKRVPVLAFFPGRVEQAAGHVLRLRRRPSPMFPVLRRFVALLLALALFAPSSAFGRVLYACSMSGEVSAGPCCCHKARVAKAHAEQAPSLPTRVERPDCCEVQEQQRAATVSSAGTVELQVLAAAPTAMLPALEPREGASGLLRPGTHAARGPPHSLPVYVTNCSLLI